MEFDVNTFSVYILVLFFRLIQKMSTRATLICEFEQVVLLLPGFSPLKLMKRLTYVKSNAAEWKIISSHTVAKRLSVTPCR